MMVSIFELVGPLSLPCKLVLLFFLSFFFFFFFPGKLIFDWLHNVSEILVIGMMLIITAFIRLQGCIYF